MAIATIKIEFNAGENIDGAFTEAIRLATLLSVWVEFKFNDVTCMTYKDGSISKGVEQYHVKIKEDTRFKIAVA